MTQFSRLKLAATLSFLVASVALVVTETSALDARPNILIILADDLGYGDLSSYGADDLKSPSIDRLVSTGIRFDNFYANCPVLLNDSKSMKSRDLFFHRREGGDRYGGLTNNAIRRGDWKLLQNSPFSPLELYNLREDPLEKNNVAGTKRREFRDLSTALRVQIQRGGAVAWQRPSRRDAE